MTNEFFNLFQRLAVLELDGIDRQVQLVGNLLIGILPRHFQREDFPARGRQLVDSPANHVQLLTVDLVIDLIVVDSFPQLQALVQ